jgi:hypothetical protein
MDAVLDTIVAGGQALIEIKHKVNKNILISTLIYQIKQNPLTAALERTCARPPAPRVAWYH